MLICTKSENYTKEESEIRELLSKAGANTMLGQAIHRNLGTRKKLNTLIATLKDYAVDDAGVLIREFGQETVNKIKSFS